MRPEGMVRFINYTGDPSHDFSPWGAVMFTHYRNGMGSISMWDVTSRSELLLVDGSRPGDITLVSDQKAQEVRA